MNNRSRSWCGISLVVLLLGIMAIGIAGGEGSCRWKRDDSSSGSSGNLVAPSNLTASAASPTQVDLSWIDNSHPEIGFDIERKIGLGGTYTNLVTLGTYSTSYSDTGLIENTTYYYRIQAIAYDAAANSSYSNEVSVTTPLAGTWTAISVSVNTPSTRSDHTAVWTDTEMIIWGGGDGTWYFSDGGIYNPAIDTWTAITAPIYLMRHTAVWTGSEMIVWGGYAGGGTYLNGGAIYNPSLDNWYAITTTDPNTPVSRTGHTAVWDGDWMVIWGGKDETSYYNDGPFFYNPASDVWSDVAASASAPSARAYHTAVCNGTQMIIWGGRDETSFFNDGGVYEIEPFPGWSDMAASTLSTRAYHTAIWTGSKMIVWGGTDGTSYFNDGGIYNPATDTWTNMTTASAPSSRCFHTAVWTGSEMIVWGGYNGTSALNTGGVYNPTTNTWRMISSANMPSARYYHTAVWTGATMIIWGGTNGTTYFNDGYTYEPAE